MTKCWCSDARRILICGSATDDRGCRRSSLKPRTNTELDGGQRANIASKSGSHGSGESPPIDHHFGHAHCSKLHVSAVSRCRIIISAGGFSDVIHIHRERDSRFLRMAPEWVMSHSKRLMGPALWNKLHTGRDTSHADVRIISLSLCWTESSMGHALFVGAVGGLRCFSVPPRPLITHPHPFNYQGCEILTRPTRGHSRVSRARWHHQGGLSSTTQCSGAQEHFFRLLLAHRSDMRNKKHWLQAVKIDNL